MIRLLCVGALKSPWAKDGCADFERRCRRSGGVEIVEIPDKNPRAEGQALMAAGKGGPLWACDPGGKSFDSEAFAELLGEHGSPRFLVGGPEGLSTEILAESQKRISLAPFTLPHELARLVLLEQIYRGLSLRRGHPYHR